ncbi:HypC/HybG/HupF family hydrogenase formation chaperone [Halioxenophilus sp. WMMB6]|uniref:HypC/HybG/HupF family hydrogenase formation chaperone n=1 Tax=Halioxenophilus sp. WMMB6 TaxID=3073815 RepID=UPI00295E538C|nr:HypC/HybG/HupF family hydrogenase formation chaperone [Halioxenophilus sp. WMMB6]
MCIGIPMQVLEAYAEASLCTTPNGELVTIDTLLVGPQQPGNWLLTFLNTAREQIEAEQAEKILAALIGLQNAIAGDSFEHLFADLIDREPQLPEFLRTSESKD